MLSELSQGIRLAESDAPSQRQVIAFFGGVYSNYLALQALLEDAVRRGARCLYCLGDIGAFGPFPDRVCEILRQTGIPVIQGNYDNSVGSGLADCQCGYTDPRDNYFAKVSYDYTFRHTSSDNKVWLQKLPSQIRLQMGPYRVLLCHGSPRKTNEFLWESTTSDAFLNWLFEKFDTDVIIGTHTGLHWHREPSRGKHFINCGAIGRPPNDGKTTVVYSILSTGPVEQLSRASCAADPMPGKVWPWVSAAEACRPTVAAEARAAARAERAGVRGESDAGGLSVDFVRLAYDYERLASDMAAEQLSAEFIETIRTGWWTTCNEILPAKERSRGIY
jgi:predicted phosphodiesterase